MNQSKKLATAFVATLTCLILPVIPTYGQNNEPPKQEELQIAAKSEKYLVFRDVTEAANCLIVINNATQEKCPLGTVAQISVVDASQLQSLSPSDVYVATNGSRVGEDSGALELLRSMVEQRFEMQSPSSNPAVANSCPYITINFDASPGGTQGVHFQLGYQKVNSNCGSFNPIANNGYAIWGNTSYLSASSFSINPGVMNDYPNFNTGCAPEPRYSDFAATGSYTLPVGRYFNVQLYSGSSCAFWDSSAITSIKTY